LSENSAKTGKNTQTPPANVKKSGINPPKTAQSVPARDRCSNGAKSSSPALARLAYAGWWDKNDFNSEGVESVGGDGDATLSGLRILWRVTQGSSCLATLG